MPEYLHPSIQSRIIDRSFSFAASAGLTDMFAVFLSAKGEDRVIKYMTSPDEYIAEYGTPDFRKYGQMPLNIKEWLDVGGGAYCLRLTPADATFSNAVVMMHHQIGEAGLEIIMSSTAIKGADAQTVSGIKTAMDNLEDNVADANGFKTMPLFTVLPRGRGQHYNNISTKMTPVDNFDETYDFRVYEFEIHEQTASGADEILSGPWLVSLDPLAVDTAGQSMYLPYVIDKYADDFVIITNETMYDDLAASLPVNLSLVDLVSGSKRSIGGVEENLYGEGALNDVSFLSTTDNDALPAPLTDFVNLAQLNFLAEGENGKATAAEINAMLALGYRGDVDERVTDKRQIVFDVLLDANEDKVVKDAMSWLADLRRDCISIIDCGITANYADAIAARRDYGYNTFLTAIFAQSFTVFDLYSATKVPVTSTWALASKIPSVDYNFGMQYPFVGPNRGSVTGIENISWMPTEPHKEALYKAQVNYIEKDSKRTKFATQLTSQVRLSALSDISHVRVLLRIQRECESLAEDYQMEFIDDSMMSSLQTNLQLSQSKWTQNRALEYITFSVSASEYDKQVKRVKIKCELKFTAIAERFFFDFIVNK